MGNEIYYMNEQPRGWHTATAKKVRNQYSNVPGESREAAYDRIKREQELRWEERTGVETQNSGFTLIMPIHNETKTFPSAFSTLRSSDIPLSVPLSIVLVTNACSDQTPQIVDEALSRLGKVEKVTLDGNFEDEKLHKDALRVTVGKRTYTHIDTASAGKANALTIGNTMALQEGHDIAMCIDANNYLEPDAVGNLYGSFRRAKDKDASTVISSGNYVLNPKKNFYKPLKGKVGAGTVVAKRPEVFGALMAWDTGWINSINGVPPVASEDYAMSVLARVSGKVIDRDLSASSWGYSAGSLSDVLKGRQRSIRGRFQIRDLYPETRELIDTELFVTKDVPGRMREFISWVTENPIRTPLYIASAMIWEYTRYKAIQDYKKDPTNHSWEPINTTK